MTPLVGAALAVVAAGCLVLFLLIAQRAAFESNRGRALTPVSPNGGRGNSITFQGPSSDESRGAQGPGDSTGNPFDSLVPVPGVAESDGPTTGQGPSSADSSTGNPLDRLVSEPLVSLQEPHGDHDGRELREPYSGARPPGPTQIIAPDPDTARGGSEPDGATAGDGSARDGDPRRGGKEPRGVTARDGSARAGDPQRGGKEPRGVTARDGSEPANDPEDDASIAATLGEEPGVVVRAADPAGKPHDGRNAKQKDGAKNAEKPKGKAGGHGGATTHRQRANANGHHKPPPRGKAHAYGHHKPSPPRGKAHGRPRSTAPQSHASGPSKPGPSPRPAHKASPKHQPAPSKAGPSKRRPSPRPTHTSPPKPKPQPKAHKSGGSSDGHGTKNPQPTKGPKKK